MRPPVVHAGLGLLNAAVFVAIINVLRARPHEAWQTFLVLAVALALLVPLEVAIFRRLTQR